MNSPKLIQRNTAKQPKNKQKTVEENSVEEFDIASLNALTDVDLSCADEVFRETYDSLAKYSTENGESQESFSSVLGDPVNNLLDHVLQQETNDVRLKTDVIEHTHAAMSSNQMMMENQYQTINYRVNSNRQYVASSYSDFQTDPYAQIATRIDTRYFGPNFDIGNVNDGFSKQFCNTGSCLNDMPAEDETSFSYAKWLNEIL